MTASSGLWLTHHIVFFTLEWGGLSQPHQRPVVMRTRWIDEHTADQATGLIRFTNPFQRTQGASVAVPLPVAQGRPSHCQ